MIPLPKLRESLYSYAALTCFRVLARALSASIIFHDKKHRPKSDGICVANHTTPIDIMTLACDNAYALTGQRHGGLNGYFQVQVIKCWG